MVNANRTAGKMPSSVALVTLGQTPAGYDPTRHNYVQKQLRLIAEGKLRVRPGTAQHVEVAHDDWCDALTGKGLYCNCDPDIRVRG
jgi:hypothetical protein